MRVKEFRETITRESYKYSGVTYYNPPKSNNDLDDQINAFLRENEMIKVIDIKYKKGRALLMYES